jgi:hypothetical protein
MVVVTNLQAWSLSSENTSAEKAIVALKELITRQKITKYFVLKY